MLEFKGRHREVMTPGNADCFSWTRRPRWQRATDRAPNACEAGTTNTATPGPRGTGMRSRTGGPRNKIDDVLHADRLDPAGSKRTFTAELNQLPDGVIVTMGGSGSSFSDPRRLSAGVVAGGISRAAGPQEGAASLGADTGIDRSGDPGGLRSADPRHGGCDGVNRSFVRGVAGGLFAHFPFQVF